VAGYRIERKTSPGANGWTGGASNDASGRVSAVLVNDRVDVAVPRRVWGQFGERRFATSEAKRLVEAELPCARILLGRLRAFPRWAMGRNKAGQIL